MIALINQVNKKELGIETDNIVKYLNEQSRDMQILLFDRLDSTNDEAKRLYRGGNGKDKLIIAKEQYGGKGRLGRSFYSPADSGIYMTLAFTTERKLSDAVMITVAASVAVWRAIEKNTGIDVGIKWVNDLYYEKKKVCGILAEAIGGTDRNHIVLGIGINLNNESFPAEIENIAGTLKVSCDVNRLVADIVNELCGFLKNPYDRSYMKDYRSHSIVLGKEVICYRGQSTYIGTACEITDDGVLIVQGKDGSRQCMDSGEISLRLS